MSRFTIQGHYFNDQYHSVSTTGDQGFKLFSPAQLTEELWQVDLQNLETKDQVNQITNSAKRGFQAMRKLSLEKRIELLKNYQEELKNRTDQIAEAIAWETGKPLWEATTEAKALIGKVDVTINFSLPRVTDEVISDLLPRTQGTRAFKPIGPALVIGPFNFPCHLANGQITSLLITGNSIIFKPSEKTLYSASLMFECLVQAGFPSGAVNLAITGGAGSEALVKHPDIKGIYFTGSVGVGKAIKRATVDSLDKMVALELGGKNATIVTSSIKNNPRGITHAVTELLQACFLTAGQRCTSTGILLVEESIVDEFQQQFVEQAKRIRVGAPFDESPAFHGPLIDEMAVEKFNSFLAQTLKDGAQRVFQTELGENIQKSGRYVPSTIDRLEFKQALKAPSIREEVFGPHVTIVPYQSLDQAFELANSTSFGLAASIFSENSNDYAQALQALDAGIINHNRSTVGAHSRLPFGGVKDSGNFRPAGVSIIDACAHEISSLSVSVDPEGGNTIELTGLM